MYFKNILKLYLVGMLVGFNNLRVLEVAIFLIYLKRHLCIFPSKNRELLHPPGKLCALDKPKKFNYTLGEFPQVRWVKIGPFI